MWKAYLKMDGWIISTLQETYLWLLDRTGVYLATVSFTTYAACCIVEVAVIDGNFPRWVWGAMLAIVGLSSGHRYYLQDKGNNDQINVTAMEMEGQRLRHVINVMLLNFLLIYLIDLDLVKVAAMVGFILFQYLFVIKVRDRDKKPFFETKQELAPQHGSN